MREFINLVEGLDFLGESDLPPITADQIALHPIKATKLNKWFHVYLHGKMIGYVELSWIGEYKREPKWIGMINFENRHFPVPPTEDIAELPAVIAAKINNRDGERIRNRFGERNDILGENEEADGPHIELKALETTRRKKHLIIFINGSKAGYANLMSSQVSNGYGYSSKKGYRTLQLWQGSFTWDGKKIEFSRTEKLSDIVPKIKRLIRSYEARKKAENSPNDE